MNDDQTMGFYGVLGRVWFDAATATLRFCPFVIDPDVTAKPVLEVLFHQPEFSAEDIERFIGEEVDVSVSSVFAHIEEVLSGETQALKADYVTAQWQPHDTQDYTDRIRQLEAEGARAWKESLDLRRRLGKAQSFAREMLRRAEIKADASPERARLQSSAITALHQMLNLLDDEEAT